MHILVLSLHRSDTYWICAEIIRFDALENSDENDQFHHVADLGANDQIRYLATWNENDKTRNVTDLGGNVQTCCIADSGESDLICYLADLGYKPEAWKVMQRNSPLRSSKALL